MPNLQYPKDVIDGLKALFPGDQEYADALESCDKSAWDITVDRIRKESEYDYVFDIELRNDLIFPRIKPSSIA